MPPVLFFLLEYFGSHILQSGARVGLSMFVPVAVLNGGPICSSVVSCFLGFSRIFTFGHQIAGKIVDFVTVLGAGD